MSESKDTINHDVYLRSLREEQRMAKKLIEKFGDSDRVHLVRLRLEKIEHEIHNVELSEQMLDKFKNGERDG